MQACDGIRVLDFSQGFAGPLASMIMAENGAEVIKVEPLDGDWARAFPGFHMWNRGKRSVVLDLTTAAGRTTAAELAMSADVLLESMRPGRADRLGIGYEELAAHNPRLVYCSVDGFGPAQSLADLHGYEGIVAARCGLMRGLDELSGAAVGTPRDRPIFKSVPVNSFAASQLAVQVVLAALLDRQRSGRGNKVGTSLVQGAAALVMRQPFARHGSEWVPRPLEASPVHRGIALCFLTVQCSDGKWIQMCARQDKHFNNWMNVLGLENLFTEPRFRGAPLGIERIEDIRELEMLIRQGMARRSQAQWMELFINTVDVGADPFLTPPEFLAHPQMTENARVVRIDDPQVGLTTQVGPLILFSETPATVSAPAPLLGSGGAFNFDGFSPLPPASVGSDIGSADRLPLEGVLILDAGYFLAGPLGATYLAELGARVVKVEPIGGDPFRRVGLEYVHLAHGKESICIDLKSAGGREVFHRLVRRADALVHSFRPGVPDRLGMDYDTLNRLNPALLYLYAASYGSKGSQSHRAAFHSTPNALMGAGTAQAGVGNPPVDDSYGDPCAGLVVGTAIVLGLMARSLTGRGQYVETTMLCSCAYAFSNELIQYHDLPLQPRTDHDQLGFGPLYRLYECARGWLFIACVRDSEWRLLTAAVGHPEWVNDPRFFDTVRRLRHERELSTELAATFKTASADSWAKQLTGAGVPAARADANWFAEFLESERMLKIDYHPSFGDYFRLPPKYSLQSTHPAEGRASGPGECTTAILAELQYTESEIDGLIQSGVVAQDPQKSNASMKAHK